MKIKLSIFLLMINSVLCQAQTEPETVRGKDLLEKIDRSDIESNELVDPIGLDTAMPALELEKIEFGKPNSNKTNTKVEKVEKVKIVEKTPEISPSKPTEKSEPIRVVEDSNSSKSKTILISKRKLSISNLELDDKVVNNDGLTYVYRSGKSDTVQYKFVGKMPYNSTGLKLISENRYLVVDLGVLKSDSENPSAIKPIERNKVAAKVEPVKPVVAEVKPNTEEPAGSTNIEAIKKEMEQKYNKGKEITKTIYLFGLKKNDIIHVSGDVQLIVRRNRNSFAIEQYWLLEKIDPNSKNLKALSANQYKVLKDR